MKARAEVGREEEGPLCDPGSELLLGGKGILLLLPVNNMTVSRNYARHYQQSSW